MTKSVEIGLKDERAIKVASLKLTKAQRTVLHGKYDGLCSYCGNALGARWHADHIEPVMRRSKWVRGQGFVPTGELDWPERDKLSNFNPSCAPCNLYKGSLSLESWRHAIQHLSDLLPRDSSPFRHALRFGLVVETRKPVVFYFERCEPNTGLSGNPNLKSIRDSSKALHAFTFSSSGSRLS